MKKIIQDENGNFITIDVQDEVVDVLWHELSKPIQLVIPEEVRKELIIKHNEDLIIGSYPAVTSILDYVKTLVAHKVMVNGSLYIYLDEIYNEHKQLLEACGVEINYKQI